MATTLCVVDSTVNVEIQEPVQNTKLYCAGLELDLESEDKPYHSAHAMFFKIIEPDNRKWSSLSKSILTAFRMFKGEMALQGVDAANKFHLTLAPIDSPHFAITQEDGNTLMVQTATLDLKCGRGFSNSWMKYLNFNAIVQEKHIYKNKTFAWTAARPTFQALSHEDVHGDISKMLKATSLDELLTVSWYKVQSKSDDWIWYNPSGWKDFKGCPDIYQNKNIMDATKANGAKMNVNSKTLAPYRYVVIRRSAPCNPDWKNLYSFLPEAEYEVIVNPCVVQGCQSPGLMMQQTIKAGATDEEKKALKLSDSAAKELAYRKEYVLYRNSNGFCVGPPDRQLEFVEVNHSSGHQDYDSEFDIKADFVTVSFSDSKFGWARLSCYERVDAHKDPAFDVNPGENVYKINDQVYYLNFFNTSSVMPVVTYKNPETNEPEPIEYFPLDKGAKCVNILKEETWTLGGHKILNRRRGRVMFNNKK